MSGRVSKGVRMVVMGPWRVALAGNTLYLPPFPSEEEAGEDGMNTTPTLGKRRALL